MINSHIKEGSLVLTVGLTQLEASPETLFISDYDWLRYSSFQK